MSLIVVTNPEKIRVFLFVLIQVFILWVMKSLTLEDLIPERAEFQLGEKTYHLRPATVEDWGWMQKKFGSDIQVKLQNLEPLELATIIFKLLETEYKYEFPPYEADDFDDDGNSIKVKMTAPLQIATRIQGFKEYAGVIRAFETSLGVHKIKLDEDTEKKILQNDENEPNHSVGEGS